LRDSKLHKKEVDKRKKHDNSIAAPGYVYDKALELSDDYVLINHLNGKYICKICDQEFSGHNALKSHSKDSKQHEKELQNLQQPGNWVAASGCGHDNQFPYRQNFDKSSDCKPPDNTTGERQYDNPKPWSIIPRFEHESELRALKDMCHSLEDLQIHGYLQSPQPEPVQKSRDHEVTPYHSASESIGHKKLQASTLPCQMRSLQTLDGQKNELVLLCVVDYFTGKALINSSVHPSNENVESQTNYSGVTAANMDEDIERGTALNGWREARSKLWELMGSETVLIGHNLKNDLEILRMIHTKIVDSAILTSKASAMIMGCRLQLHRLCKQLLTSICRTVAKKNLHGWRT
jgi:hypothetical protein